jgi:hypothetical protein
MPKSDQEDRFEGVWGPFTVLHATADSRMSVNMPPTGGVRPRRLKTLAGYKPDIQIQDYWRWAAVSVSVAGF